MTPAQQKLFETAAAQGGFFSAKDAYEAGILHANHGTYTRSGQWEKAMHGIYRLRTASKSELSLVHMLAVWLRGHDRQYQGAFGRFTALWLYGLVPEARVLDVMVGRNFRRSKLPGGVEIYRDPSCTVKDLTTVSGLPAVRPLAALRELITVGQMSETRGQEVYLKARVLGTISGPEIASFLYETTKFSMTLTIWEQEYEKISVPC